MKDKNTTKVQGIYDVSECKRYRMSKTERIKQLSYMSICIKAKPRLEEFIHINSLDSEVKAGEFEEKENLDYYHNPKLELLLYSKNCEDAESFMLFGKRKSVLKYLKKNHPKVHLRLYNYLKHGIDSEFAKKILETYGSPAHVKGYEEISGIKLTQEKEE